MAGKILEAKLVIGGKDETGGMLSAIQAKIAKMSASAAATSKSAQSVMQFSVNASTVQRCGTWCVVPPLRRWASLLQLLPR
jgi:hypothetical protein